MSAPPAPQKGRKRCALVALDENSRGSNSSSCGGFNENSNDELPVKRKPLCPLPKQSKAIGRQRIFAPTPTPIAEVFPSSFFQYSRRKLFAKPELKQDYFEILPNEMILRVLKWLPKVALGRMATVNKRFNALASHESLWKRIDMSGKFIASDHMNVIMSRNPVYLRLCRSKVNDANGLEKDFSALQLTHLDLSMVVISSPALTQILGMCSSLKKLSLENVEVSSEALLAMRVFAHSIETLNLTMSEITAKHKLFTNFLGKSKKLTSLNMGWVRQSWTRANVMKIVNNLPAGLQELNMSGFRNNLVDTHVQILADRCTKLTDLDLSDCQELTMLALEAISTLEKIQRLGLSRCYSIEMSAYCLLTRMKSLHHLEVYQLLKEESIKTLETNLPNVRVNNYLFSTTARPTVGCRRSSIWGERVRD